MCPGPGCRAQRTLPITEPFTRALGFEDGRLGKRALWGEVPRTRRIVRWSDGGPPSLPAGGGLVLLGE